MFKDRVVWVAAILLFILGGIFFRLLPSAEFWKVDIAGFLGMISSVATAIGVIVAVYFGKKGLDTWKYQNNAAINNDLVRRISIALLKYEEAMTQLRSPFMHAGEMAPREGEKDSGDYNEQRHLQSQRGYTRRLERVSAARLDVYAALLESQIFWGETPVELFKKVFEFEKDFTSYLRVWFELHRPDRDEDERKPYKEILSKKRDVMYDDLSEEGDDFRKEFKASVETMKCYLKSKLVYTDHHPDGE